MCELILIYVKLNIFSVPVLPATWWVLFVFPWLSSYIVLLTKKHIEKVFFVCLEC